MICSITLKGRFGEKLWSNWRCISLSFDAGRSFFLVLPVYFNRQMKAMLVSSIINIFDGKFTSANLLASAVLPTFFAGQVGYTAMYSMYYFIYSIMCILFFSWSHENSLKGASAPITTAIQFACHNNNSMIQKNFQMMYINAS